MWLLGWMAGCGTTCSVDGPLDYTDSAQWICRPGDDRVCADSLPTRTVMPDGSVVSGAFEATPSPEIACFVVYPTVDLRLGAGLHHDTESVPKAEDWARMSAGPLRQVCDLYVPVYRQVLIGTYGGKTSDKKEQCLDAAYEDVRAAFEQFLVDEPERRFVLFGHSQGGQHLSRLMKERVETDDAVLGRMVAAYPLGWPVGTGSWDRIGPCESADQTGCAFAFRSYAAGEDGPEEEGRFVEGETFCSNPANPGAASEAGVLTALTLPHDSLLIDAPSDTPDGAVVRYEQALQAQCAVSGTTGLQLAWTLDDPPFRLDQALLTTGGATHILDVNVAVEDLVADIARRAQVALP